MDQPIDPDKANEHGASAVEINQVRPITDADQVVATCICGWRSSIAASEGDARALLDTHIAASPAAPAP